MLPLSLFRYASPLSNVSSWTRDESEEKSEVAVRIISGMKIVDGYRVMSESSSPSRIERGDKVEESVEKAQGTKDG
ncbi:hypothetical protein MY1884_000213 [Beauveria asiatica]